jgi:predicted PurR-regulated permease PerM
VYPINRPPKSAGGARRRRAQPIPATAGAQDRAGRERGVGAVLASWPERVGGTALVLGLVGLGLWILHAFFAALVWAAVFAIITWPIYRRFAPLLPSRSEPIVAPLVLTAAIGLVFIVPFTFVAIEIGREMRVLIPLVVEARHNGIAEPSWLTRLPWIGGWVSQWWRANLADPGTAEALLGHINTSILAESARQVGVEIVHRLTIFFFTLLALFFLFRDGAVLSRQLLEVSDRLFGARGERIALQMISAVHGTVNGLVLVGLAEGILIGISYVVVGLPYAVPVAALTAVAAVIPFGAPVVFCAAALYLLAQSDLAAAVIVLGTGFFVVFIADHFVRPVLIGGAARLPFLWVLLGILGGLESFGVLGLFVGPAVMAALISLWREWTSEEDEGAPQRP